MKALKKTVRFLALSFIIIAAAAGAGLFFALVPRHTYMDKEIRIERVDKKANEEDESQEKKN